MQHFVVFSILFSAALSFSANNEVLWNKFKADHHKVYKSIEEERIRLNAFLENVRKIEEHNVRYRAGLETFQLGITKFADMTAEEFNTFKTLADSTNEGYQFEDVNIPAKSYSELPDEVDWRKEGVVGSIVDQGGACWASAALSALESIYALKHGKLYRLSRQNLIDCTAPFEGQGSYGELWRDAYQYIKENGIMTEDAYPYTGEESPCKFDPEKGVMKIDGSRRVAKGERALQEAVANVGPIAAFVNATEWLLYVSGILEAKKPSTGENFVATVVGYGTENGTDYWLIKSSFGPYWGENGYIRIARNKNMFGIGNSAMYPLVN